MLRYHREQLYNRNGATHGHIILILHITTVSWQLHVFHWLGATFQV